MKWEEGDLMYYITKYKNWIFNIASIVALIFYFRWGGVRSLTGVVVGAIVTTMLLATKRGKMALDTIDKGTQGSLFKTK